MSLQAIERTLSELNLLGPDAWPAWTHVLQKVYKANYGRSEDPIYLHMASRTRLGAVTLLAVQFHDFLPEDGRYMMFLMSMTDSTLLSTIQSNQVGQLAWQMPKTKEYFHLTGKFYICSAPRHVTRYAPPLLPHLVPAELANASTAQRQYSKDFWELKRVQEWKKLTPKMRASFSWPQTGQTPKSPASAYQCLVLDDLVTQDQIPNLGSHVAAAAGGASSPTTPLPAGSAAGNRDSMMSQDSARHDVSSPSSPISVTSFRSRWSTLSSSSAANGATDINGTKVSTAAANVRKDNPTKIQHDLTLDNFCLLVFKPLDIVHFESSPLPPRRTIYTADEDGQWAVCEANP
ncbi:hypothetical protein DFQ27_001898 [Actinomortierella ambigua]|uniref:Pyridoxamine 5'-phosphate oxidase Alr4036 family FMN-binding domain-containing protein n=1 Tax=Actinomortierella ambigua TaxID=1343610 RepID=A0A9P6QBR0_9FUNG|nr:hypothetical protein DFQ27_001898 [Actinomortierella ambigua]